MLVLFTARNLKEQINYIIALSNKAKTISY